MKEGSPVEPWPYAPADAHGWPEVPGEDEQGSLGAEQYKAKLEVRKARTEAEIARAQADADADTAIEQEYYKGVLEVAKGAIDRARASADTVQKAAAAVVTLYTGVLALAFAAASNPLPDKALFAAVLLGLAILLSTAFLAYLPDPESTDAEALEVTTAQPLGQRLTDAFVGWTRRAAVRRAGFLRGSVVALAGAVVLIPAPFVELGTKEVSATTPSWPKVDPAAGGDLALRRIVYKAQVDEVATRRKAPAAKEENTAVWWVLFGSFAVVALVLALAPERSRRAAPST